MIADKILDLIFGLVKALLSLLPSYDFAHGGAFGDLLNLLGNINEFFPIDTLAESIIMYFTFSVILLGLKPILKMGRVA